MAFCSLKYLLFLAAVTAVYYLLPQRLRCPFLLLASYAFYASFSPGFCLLLVAATAVSWGCALASARRLLGRDTLWIVLGALWLFGALFLYKYLEFFVRSAQTLLGGAADFSSGLLLPVGISFYTFSAASYLFDVKKGRAEPEPDFLRYALYIAFFPSVLSGPINRAGQLLPQIRSPRGFSYERFKRGLMRFAVGAVKKLVLADALAMFVSAAFSDAENAPGAVLLAAALCNSFQTYFDFAGYTDMALGSALILGFELGENFRAPYLAQSVKDFWRRWHISLTSWLRDYIYFPLGGSRISRARTIFNTLVVFLVSGLWHGADGSFLIWGLLNGLYQVLEILLDRPLRRLPDRAPVRLCRGLVTFLLVSAAWVFFTADTTGRAVLILGRIAACPLGGMSMASLREYTGIRRLGLALLCTALFLIAELRRERTGVPVRAGLEKQSFPYWLTLGLTAFFIAVFGCYGGFSAQTFVYFKF